MYQAEYFSKIYSPGHSWACSPSSSSNAKPGHVQSPLHYYLGALRVQGNPAKGIGTSLLEDTVQERAKGMCHEQILAEGTVKSWFEL